jgi:hypothetical protein
MVAVRHGVIGHLGRGTLMLALLLVPQLALAANHYVRAGAVGTGSGADWTNAYTNLPTALVRGDTYYVANGTYEPHTFKDAVSGASVITVKGATALDHGTATGWLPSHGVDVAPAVFTSTASTGGNVFVFITGRYTIDGGTRSTLMSGYGFKLDITQGGCTGGCHSVFFDRNATLGDITIRHTEINGFGQSSTIDHVGLNICSATLPNGYTNLTFQYLYLHDFGVGGPIGSCHIAGMLLEQSVITRNKSTPAAHSEAISDAGSSNVTIRYNQFLDIQGTGFIVNLAAGGPWTANNWAIYGNVFAFSEGNPYGSSIGGDGVIACINNNICDNWLIYNNTFVNIQGVGTGGPTSSARIGNWGNGTGWVVQNNIWYNCANAKHLNVVTADYNYYINTAHIVETHEQTSPTADPFVNWPSNNFRLQAYTNPGVILPSPYDLTPDGVKRDIAGWDRGAYQFGTRTRAPRSPTNVILR